MGTEPGRGEDAEQPQGSCPCAQGMLWRTWGFCSGSEAVTGQALISARGCLGKLILLLSKAVIPAHAEGKEQLRFAGECDLHVPCSRRAQIF